MRIFKRLLLTLVMLTILPPALAFALLASEAGSRWLVEIALRHTQGMVSVAGIKGNLLDRVELDSLRVQHGGLELSIEQSVLDWRPWALLDGTLHIETLSLRGWELTPPPAAAEDDKGQESGPIALPERIELPLRLRIDQVVIEDVVIADGGPNQRIDKLALSLSSDETSLRIDSVELAAPSITLALRGAVGSQAPFPIDLQIDWGFAHELATFQGEAAISGDLDRLNLTHQLRQPYLVDTRASVEAPLSDPRWQATMTSEEISWPPVGEDPAETLKITHPELELHGDLTSANAEIALSHSGMGIPPGAWKMSVTANQEEITLARLRGEILGGEVLVSGDYQIEARTGSLNLDAKALTPALAAEGLEETLGKARLDLSGSFAVAGERLRIEALDLHLPEQAILSLSGSADQISGGTPELDLAASWRRLRWPLQGESILVQSLAGSLNLKGVPQDYALTMNGQLEGDPLPPSQWRIEGKGGETRFEITDLLGQLPQGTLSGNASTTWTPTLSARVDLQGKAIHLAKAVPDWSAEMPADLTLMARLEGERFEVRKLTLELPAMEAALQATAEGLLKNDEGLPTINAAAAWENLRWPLSNEPALINTPAGELAFNGSARHYQTTLKAELFGKDIPQGVWTLSGNGDDTGFHIASLVGETLGGEIRGAGELGWSPRVSWQFDLEGESLNPGEQWVELPGEIRLSASTQGALAADGGIPATLHLGPIVGTLRGYPLEVEAEAESGDSGYQLKSFRLRSNDNLIEAEGRLADDTLQAKWRIDLPAIDELLPGGQGALAGEGALAGPLNAPAISARLKGKELSYNDSRLRNLDLDMAIDPLGSEAVRVALNAGPLLMDDVAVLERVSVSADGVIGEHRIAVDGRVDEQRQLALNLVGGFDLDSARWNGRIETVELASGGFGDWRAAQPAELALSSQAASLSRICLRDGGDAALCAALEWAAARGTSFLASLENLPASWLNPNIEATLGGDIKGELGTRGEITADAVFSISEGVIRVPHEQGKKDLRHRGGEIFARVNDTGLSANLQLGLLDNSRISGEFSMPGLTALPPDAKQPIQGQFIADIADINVLTAFVPALGEASGSIQSNLTLGGDLETPRIEGKLLGQEMAATLPRLGLALREITLAAVTDADNPALWNLELGAKSGDGELAVKGRIDIQRQQADLNINGRAFKVIDTPDAKAVISPELQLRASPESIHARGSITLPVVSITPQISVIDMVGGKVASGEARAATPRQSATLPSSDVVIVGREAPADAVAIQPLKTELLLDTDVEVRLGTKVFVDTVGFRSRLEGAVRLRHDIESRELIPIADGEIRIVDGTYRSFGQDLEINQGRLLFSNVPANKPEIDVRAVRRIYDDPQVSAAGIHITGTPEKLDLRLFSEPELDQSAVMSYILTGTAPDNRGQSLGLGTYLRPNLYVGYDVDLLDNSGAFNLRYQIKHNFGVEAEVGESDNVITFSYVLEK